MYDIDLFSDPGCLNHIGTFVENATTISEGGYENFYPMFEVATGPWGSAKVVNMYNSGKSNDNSS